MREENFARTFFGKISQRTEDFSALASLPASTQARNGNLWLNNEWTGGVGAAVMHIFLHLRVSQKLSDTCSSWLEGIDKT